MNRRTRAISYGSAGASMIAGALCAAIIGGGTGPILGIVLIGLGLVGVVSLVFLEVGLSEDRDRERSRMAGLRSAPRGPGSEVRRHSTAGTPPGSGRNPHLPPPPASPASSRPPRLPARARPRRPDRMRGRRRRLR